MTRLRRTRILLLSIQKAGNWTATALTWTIINQCRSTRRGSRLILIYIIHVSITARNDDIVRRQIAVLPAGSNTATRCCFTRHASTISLAFIIWFHRWHSGPSARRFHRWRGCFVTVLFLCRKCRFLFIWTDRTTGRRRACGRGGTCC